MKLINCIRTSGGFICLVLVVILTGQLAHAEYVIHESATMGPAGQFEGYLVDETQFIGARFYVDRRLEVTQIGGHIAQGIFGADFFGAIVSLSGPGDLPDGYPFTAGDVVASTVFDPGYFSSDYRTPLSVELNPGYYALVFGTDALGSTNGYGMMPFAGQTSYPSASYFVYWPGFGWLPVESNDTRFVIEGNTKYCDASGSNYVEYQYIMGVQAGDIDNIPTGNNHYADYTSLAASMEREVGYPITVTRGKPYNDDYDRCGAWVDWNRDGVFTGLNEQITMSLGVDPCTFTGTITPPATAVLGDTRMRVRIRWYETPLSCGDTDYGEVEDYTITVVRGDYCGASGSNYSEYQYIMGVQVGGINNIPTGNNHYADYTSLYTMMEPMVGYPITVTRGNPYTNDRCGLWADWNQDGDFYDVSEQIPMSIGLDPCTFTGTVTPPADAGLCDTRMRVRIVWNKVPQPCGDTDYGEVEDYTITFVSSVLPKISGHVRTAGSEGIEDVLITGTNNIGSTMTDVNGYYELTAPTNPWSGGLTPSKTYWDFFPDMWGLVSVTQDTPNTDFEGTYNYNYGGGQGTVATPYLINTAEHMNEIGTHTEHWDAFFKLMADIDLGGYTGSAFNIIGNVNDGPFSGWFNGNGHKIYNFTYHSNGIDRIGLFGDIDGMLTTIENLTLINPDVDAGTGERVGALVGRMSNSSKILDCKVIGGSVSGAFAVGGLVGLIDESVVGQCFSSSSVSGGYDVGGLVGVVWRATLSGSYSTGPVQSTLSYIGGLAGSVQEGTVYECYAMGSVSGGDRVGGLVGEVYAYSRPAVISDCYATGLVTGDEYAYGLIAFNYVDAGSILDSFWDVESSGQLISLGGTGLTTAEMQMQSTFTDAGWDFTTKPVWKMNCEGMSYPKLHWWQPVLGDFGCPDGVNFFDFSFFSERWAEENCAASNDCDGRDLDQLGSVDIKDLRIFADNWLAGM